MMTIGDSCDLHLAHRSRATSHLLSIFILAAMSVSGAQAANALNNRDLDSSRTQQGSRMSNVTFGENSKLTALPSERDRIRSFYRDVLGCPMTKKSDRADVFKIGTTFYLGVIYDDAAQSAKDRFQSIWLELRTDHPQELKQKILQSGVAEIEYWDKEHFYFQAPGGQVFRLAGSNEDMSKWQR